MRRGGRRSLFPRQGLSEYDRLGQSVPVGGRKRTTGEVILAQAYYFSDDFAAAWTTSAELIAAEERDGRPVPEEQLQILAKARSS